MIGVLAAIALAVGLTGRGRQTVDGHPADTSYDIVRYRLRWTVGSRVPSDGRLRAAGATAAATAG